MATPQSDLEGAPRALFVCSHADVATLESIEALGDVAAAILKDNAGGELDARARAALIEAVRAGKHVELRARAITFRQRDGSPNKNFLRFKSSKLGEIAASFVGKPFLLDHSKSYQQARMGTIEESEAVPLAGGWVGFRQTLRAVKPHAVVSILDGTLDRFSIGWDPRGTVICTAHGVDVRSKKSCYWLEDCYPGKLVEVDGETKIAEYEWQSTEGLESSGVNTPAVSGTKIENVRAALAAELSLTPDHETERKDRPMPFPKLAAALALATLAEGDDDRAGVIVTELRAELAAANAEKSAAIKRAELAEKDAAEVAPLRARVAELESKQVDAILEAQGYRAGKLIRGKDAEGKSVPSAREVRLRRIAAEPGGLAALEAELAELDVVVPIGQRELSEVDPTPRTRLAVGGDIPPAVLASTAKQMGLSVEELSTHAATLSGKES